MRFAAVLVPRRPAAREREREIAKGKKMRNAASILLFVVALTAGLVRAQDTATLDGEPAIRFLAGHGHLTTYCDGQLWITATRVRFDGLTRPADSFDLRRGQVKTLQQGHALGFDYIKVQGGGDTYRMGIYPDVARQFGDRIAFVARAWSDFAGAYAEVQRAEAQRRPPAGLVQASAGPEGPMLEFPVIVRPGGMWFKSRKKVTVWEDPQADGSAYAQIYGVTASGRLQVTAERVRFVPSQAAGEADVRLDSPRTEMQVVSGAGGYPRVIASVRGERVSLLLGTADGGGLHVYDATPLLRALGPQFPQMAAELLPRPVLLVSTNPGAEVFADGERRGMAGSDGKLRLTTLAPGKHRLRATLAGYQPWEGEATLVSGEEKDFPVVLTALPAPKPAGDPPLALGDIVKMLEAGVSPGRVSTLVQQRGVGFALDEAADKRIRAAGGDAELLVAIAKAKR